MLQKPAPTNLFTTFSFYPGGNLRAYGDDESDSHYCAS